MIARLDFHSRYATGLIEAIHPLAIDVRLTEKRNGIDLVRIHKKHWPAEHPKWREGMPIEKLFIYDLSAVAKAGQGGHWFGSLRWLDIDTNPWEKHNLMRPHVGAVLDGDIINHAGSNRGVVELEASNIEAYLPLAEVPEGYKGMDECFPIGLKVRCEVKEIDFERCEITLSVSDLLKKVHLNQGTAPHIEGERHPITPYLRFLHRQPLLPNSEDDQNKMPSWQGYGICIVDDDQDFGRNLCAWFQQLGAKAWIANNPEHIKALLKENSDVITHLLIDYDLGGREARAKIWKAIHKYRAGQATAIISGTPENDAPKYAQRFGYAFFPKPISFAALHQWLTQCIAPHWDSKARYPAKYWEQSGSAYQPKLRNEASAWLAEVCECSEAIAAIWVRCYHPGYDLVATHGFDLNKSTTILLQLPNQLQQTIVQDVELTAQKQTQFQSSGPLAPIWPPFTNLYAEALHTTTSHEQAPPTIDDVLLVFSKEKFILESPGSRPILAWWQSLLLLEQTETRLLEDATFATQGRVHSATLHELRPLMQVFESNTQWDERSAKNWWPSGKKARQLLDSSLYNIRPERNQQLNLHERLYTLMHTFLWQIIERREVSVIVSLPATNLNMHLPPEVLEQPLINLIDNATKFCKGRRWAKVKVQVYLDVTDQQHPLVIQVHDQGRGMTPQEERHLFHPRHTASGHKGFGMGLYVSQSLAKAVGGVLRLKDNRRWIGCCFELRLPLTWIESPKEKEIG